jgi:hypothetical protein
MMNVLLVFPALCIYDTALESTERKANCCISFRRLKPSGEEMKTDGKDSKPTFTHRTRNASYVALHQIRWFLLVGCAVAFGVSAYYASTLSLPICRRMFACWVEIMNSSRAGCGAKACFTISWRKLKVGSQVYVIWGLKPADTGDQSKSISQGPKLTACFQSPSDLNESFVFSFQTTRPVFFN